LKLREANATSINVFHLSYVGSTCSNVCHLPVQPCVPSTCIVNIVLVMTDIVFFIFCFFCVCVVIG
jgi:hypothetical protein